MDLFLVVEPRHIKRFFKSRKITQEAIARKTGTSQEFVCKVFSGKRKPPAAFKENLFTFIEEILNQEQVQH